MSDLSFRPRRGGRVVEGSGLENRRVCKGSVGSNPTLSANRIQSQRGFLDFSREAAFALSQTLNMSDYNGQGLWDYACCDHQAGKTMTKIVETNLRQP
jgi:hypothetical protein